MSKQHCRSNRQLCCLLLRQCCRFGQHCRSNVPLCRKDEISTQNSFVIVAVFGNKVERCFDIVAGVDRALARSRRGPLRRSTMTASDSVSPHIGWGCWLSSRIWSSHRFGGRPGRRFHERSGGRPRDKSTWQLRA